ncbi:hypothetical protein BDV18DRAFT_156514 [Aspergillus unguis]
MPRDYYAVLESNTDLREPHAWVSNRFLVVGRDSTAIEEWYKKAKLFGLKRVAGTQHFMFDEWFLFFYLEYTAAYHDSKESAGWMGKLLPHRLKPEHSQRRFRFIEEKTREVLRNHYKEFVDRIQFINIPDRDYEALAIKNLTEQDRKDGKENGYDAFTITAPCDWLLNDWYETVIKFYPGELKRTMNRKNRYRSSMGLSYFKSLTETKPEFKPYKGFIHFDQVPPDDPRVEETRRRR